MDGSAENRGEGTRRTDEPLPSHVREELNENDPDELEDEMAATLADWTASCGTALGLERMQSGTRSTGRSTSRITRATAPALGRKAPTRSAMTQAPGTGN